MVLGDSEVKPTEGYQKKRNISALRNTTNEKLKTIRKYQFREKRLPQLIFFLPSPLFVCVFKTQQNDSAKSPTDY
jgi:hypothetical protein